MAKGECDDHELPGDAELPVHDHLAMGQDQYEHPYRIRQQPPDTNTKCRPVRLDTNNWAGQGRLSDGSNI
ncbi:hypothetical protein [Fodinicola acaciae]|uniref:hypothetical protein n=1 Tax=Fodinicola acaciae TaxID=2681555 RepID=UPI0013D8A313|nr:hypothetical protein [Fodinicola acaciae]